MIFTKILMSTIQVKNKMLIIFDDIVGNIVSIKKHNPMEVELLYIRVRKPFICLVFITQLYFAVPKILD